MLKSLSIPQFFGAKKTESRSIQSIKLQAVAKRSKAAVQPFWFYASSILIALNVIVLFSYLLGVNAQAASGYEIQKVQDKLQVYIDANKQLNLKISEQSSIAEIQTDFLKGGFTPAGQPKFLQVNSYTVR
jgi:hypothetical protein